MSAGERSVDRHIRRDQWIVGGCLLVVATLAWLWLVRQAGGGAPAATSMASMGMASPASPEPLRPGAYFAAAFVMWSLMMTAMMLPSAAPMILLYARFSRGVKQQGGALAPTALFVAVYLAVWAAFSAAAAAVQTGLVQTGVVTAARLRVGDARLAGVLLIAIGLYQVTPLKQACLGACRSPLSFLTRFWRPGAAGAMRLGFAHGLFCLGCCWLMMALLFVVGVMSLAWVGVIALIVLIEKAAPMGPRIGIAIGLAAAAAGLLMIVGAPLPLHL